MKKQISQQTWAFYLIGFFVLGLTSVAWSSNWGVNVNSQLLESPNAVAQLIVNQDQFEGSWKQFKGELKKEWGEFTDDDLLAIEGKMDKFEGKLQERYGDRKEELKEWVDQWFERHTFESQSSMTTKH